MTENTKSTENNKLTSQTYDDLKKEIEEKIKITAKEYIPKLCDALKHENPQMSKSDIMERIKKDFVQIWAVVTIRDAAPDEYKDEIKAEAGRKGRRRQLEDPITVPVLTRAETNSDSKKEQDTETSVTAFDNEDQRKQFIQQDETQTISNREVDPVIMQLQKENEELKTLIKEKNESPSKAEPKQPTIAEDEVILDINRFAFAIMAMSKNGAKLGYCKTEDGFITEIEADYHRGKRLNAK